MSNLIVVEKAGQRLPVHPDALVDHQKQGWQISDHQHFGEVPPLIEDGYGYDDELRAAIEAATGKAPHHKMGRPKLIEQYDAIKVAAQQEELAANGLTRREIEADLIAMEVEFDPADQLDDLTALRDLAREERDMA